VDEKEHISQETPLICFCLLAAAATFGRKVKFAVGTTTLAQGK
jgi:hypothetical protein